jgi:hypothetical protein
MTPKPQNAFELGINYLRTKGWEDGRYSQTWAEDAEADGFYVWILDFSGSNADYARLSLFHTMLDGLFGRDHYMIETGENLMRIVFDSASDAIRFRFALADITA